MKKVGLMCNLMTSYGGIQTCVISLIRGLNQQGITPILLCDRAPKKDLWEEQGLKCEVQKINFSFSAETFFKYDKFLFPIWEFIFFFKTSWLKEKFDFIYIFEPNTIINTDQKHLFYLSMSPRAHGYSKNKFLSRFKNQFYRLFVKRIHPIFEYQNYNCVINSNYTAGMFYDYFGKQLVVVNPPNTVEASVPAITVKKEKSVIFLSRLVRPKKIEKMLDLAKNHPDHFFYILGAVEANSVGYLEEIKAGILKLGLNNIQILENLKHSVVTEYLSMAEYYVFFAENEHFGITTVEAMLFGCIPFVHNSGGQKEIVLDERLRFEYENMENKFRSLVELNVEEKNKIKVELSQHVKFFKEEVFIQKMLAYLPTNE